MSNDRQIQKDVITALDYSPVIATEHIGVTVEDGVVTLSGSVSNYAEKYSAEKACFRVRGVKAIADEIEVILPGTHARSDAAIARAAVDTLSWNVLVPASVQVSVEKGRLILRGQVDWEFQRSAAEKALRNLIGITGLVNHIAIQKQVHPQVVKDRIEHALQSSTVENINIEVAGSKVILIGTVHSSTELDTVKWAVWAVPGVSEVETRLDIDLAPP